MDVLNRVARHADRPAGSISRRDVARWLVTEPEAAATMPALRRELMAAGRPFSAAFWEAAQALLDRIAERSATRGDVTAWLEATGSEPTAVVGLHVWAPDGERRPLADRLHAELVEHLEALVHRGAIDPDRLLARDADAVADHVEEQERWLDEPLDATTSRMMALLDEADEEFLADWDEADADALDSLEAVLAEVGERPLPRDDLRAATARLRTSLVTGDRPYDLLASCGGVAPDDLPAADDELWLALAAGVVSPMDEPPDRYPIEMLSSWYALEHADWLAAVGELARRGPGAPAGTEDLVRYLAGTDLVDGELEADDLAVVEFGFGPVVELWTALGAVDDRGRLTTLGWWGLPEAQRHAWAPSAERA